MKSGMSIHKICKIGFMGVAACLFLYGCNSTPSNKENDNASNIERINEGESLAEKASIAEEESILMNAVTNEDGDAKEEVVENDGLDASQMINVQYVDDSVYVNAQSDAEKLMSIQYPQLEYHSQDSNDMIIKILDQVNNGCKGEADSYHSGYEDLARSEYKEITDWEDGSYFYYSKAYLRNTSSKIFSMAEEISSYAHGAHSCCYYNTFNFDVMTGNEILFSNLISDKEALYSALKIALLEKYDASVFYDEDTLSETLHDYVFDPSFGELTFTIENDGVSFWFGNYDLAPFAEGCQMVTIPFEGNEGLFQKEYVSE